MTRKAAGEPGIETKPAPLEPVAVETSTRAEDNSQLEASAPRAAPAAEADTAVSPSATVRCFVLQAFAHVDTTYQPGDWLDLPPDWAAEHQRTGNVTDYAGYLARASNPGGNQ